MKMNSYVSEKEYKQAIELLLLENLSPACYDFIYNIADSFMLHYPCPIVFRKILRKLYFTKITYANLYNSKKIHTIATYINQHK